jgi:Bacterial membrane protein YfhO
MALPDERKHDLAAIAILVAILTILFSDILLFGRCLATRDLSAAAFPQRRIVETSWRAGAVPHWTHLIAGGQPVAANPGFQTFYPIRLLTLLIPSAHLGFHLEILLHFYLAAIGLFVLLRSMNVTRRSSLAAALALALGGLLPSLSNLPLLLSVAWLPWILFYARRFYATRDLRHFAVTSLLLGVLLLAGEPSVILQAGALVVAFAFYDRRPDTRTLALAVLICVVASLVAAVQIAPALDFDRGRNPGFTYGEVTKWSLHPLRLIELVWAPAVDPGRFVFSFYPGLLIGIAIVYGFVTRVRTWRFTAVVATLSLLAALGSYGPVFPLLYRLGIRGVRYPEKFFLAGWLVLVIFAAIALDELARRFRPLSIAAIVAVVMLVDLVPRLPGVMKREAPGYYDPPPIARSLAPSARIFNDAAWQWVYDPRLSRTSLEAMRTIARNAMFEQRPAAFGIQSVLEDDVNRTHLPHTAQFADAFWRIRRQAIDKRDWLLSLAGVTDVLVATPEKLKDARSEFEIEPVAAIPQGNTRYSFAREILTARSGDELVAAVLNRTTPPGIGAGGRVVDALEGPNFVQLQVEASGDGLLVLAITRHEYWRATIDGRDVPILPANLAFQAVRVPAGRHRVVMRYRNPVVVWSGAVSLIAAAALIWFAARPRSR